MSEAVRRIGPDDLQPATPTPGLARNVADESDTHWVGHVTAEPDTMSGWHHHGAHTTIGYVVDGTVRLEFGPSGKEDVTITSGDYFVVPPGTIHREGNPTDREAHALVFRYGDGPPVYPAAGPEEP